MKRYVALLIIPFLLGACSTCGNLRQKDEKLTDRFNSFQAKYEAQTWDREKYLDKLLALREKELQLFEQVRNCEFEDKTEHNYWYRARLKFPSQIEMAIDRLQLDAP